MAFRLKIIILTTALLGYFNCASADVLLGKPFRAQSHTSGIYPPAGTTAATFGNSHVSVWGQLVAAGDTSDKYEISFARFTPTGELLDEPARKLPTPVFNMKSLGVAGLSNSFVIVYEQGPYPYAVRVGASGQILDGTPIQLTTNRGCVGVKVVASSDRYLIGWWRLNGGLSSVEGVLLSADGQIERAITFGFGPLTNLELTTDGTDFLACWINHGGARIEAVTVGPGGEIKDVNPVNVSGNHRPYTLSPPQAGWNGQSFAIVWGAIVGASETLPPSGGSNAVWGASFSVANGSGAPAILSTSARSGSAPPQPWLIAGREEFFLILSINDVRSLEVIGGTLALRERFPVPAAAAILSANGSTILLYQGTDPRNGKAIMVGQRYFRQQPPLLIESMTVNATSQKLHWLATPGVQYHLESAANLANPNWTAISAPVVASEVTANHDISRRSEPQLFYRVRLSGQTPAEFP